MCDRQQSNSVDVKCRPRVSQRICALLVFFGISWLFWLLHKGAAGQTDLSRIFGICEFKRSYNLPCFACGMTTSSLAFVSGDILGAFYIQPAGAIICCGLVIIGVFALLIGLFGVNFSFLKRPLSPRSIRYFVISLLVILAGGWAVTIARAISDGKVN
jgi:hypothetical protein